MIAVLGLCVAGRVQAEMSSANFSIQWDTISAGGSDTSSSASYILRDTVGNQAGGSSAGTSYAVNAGYRQGTFDEIISVNFAGQDDASQVSATALSGNTISVSSVAPFEVQRFIVLVQDLGPSQVSAMGTIQSIDPGELTVYELFGGSPVIDGVNDYVFLLGSSSLSFGTLPEANVVTKVIGFNVLAEVPGGYTMHVREDGDLRDGGDAINDVADGAVTAGEEEYGARSSDTTISDSDFDTEDAAITSEFLPMYESAVPPEFSSEHFLFTLKVSREPDVTPEGTYGHALTFIVAGNY